MYWRKTMKNNNLMLAGVALVAASGMILSACSSGGGGGLAEPTCDTTGTWVVDSTINSSSPACAGSYYEQLYITINQTGNTLDVDVLYGGSFTGSISGSTISWSGSYPDDGVPQPNP
jgi:hypothetical protein